MPAIITLTTDFGQGSPYIAQMKGVILSLNPEVTIVDVTHAISPQAIREATYVLDDVCHWFPPASIHIAVIDPGVGTKRDLVCARIDGHLYVAPNNGLLTQVLSHSKPDGAWRISDRQYWLPAISSTFHGRDIMAPVAARLSLGLDACKLGPRLETWSLLDLPQPRLEAGAIQGAVVHVDSFGNLITNIDTRLLIESALDQDAEIHLADHCVAGILTTYREGIEGRPLALIGSSGRLEIAVAGGSAAVQLQVDVGTPVVVQPRMRSSFP